MVAEPTAERTWTIFLSHSSKDKRFADWLYSKLQSADLTVWYDKYEILVGDSIVVRIGEGLEGSELLIVVVSRQAIRSNWVKAELEPKILERIEGNRTTVLPLTLDTTDPENISIFLKGKRWLRFRRRGWDETFRELLKSIEGHLAQRGLRPDRRLLPAPTTQHIRQNPFGLRGGIEPERFVVPERLVRDLTEDLVKKQSVSLVGARMMGKTSLLKFLAADRCQPYYLDERGHSPPLRFVYLDLQEHAGGGRDQLLPALADAISEKLPKGQRFHGQTHAQALTWVKETAGRRRTGDPLWIVLLDEFDRIVELDGLDKILFDELRSLPHHYNLCFVIASRRKLIDLPLPQGVSTSPFFNLFKEHFLAVWDESTVRSFMFRPREVELQLFTADDFSQMARLTAHHPILLQIGCYHLFNLRHEAGQAMVNYDILLQRYMQEAASVYRYYWNHEINDGERQWLCDCWQALSEQQQEAIRELQYDTQPRKNRTIRLRLERLGLVLSTSGTIDLPGGVTSFLGSL